MSDLFEELFVAKKLKYVSCPYRKQHLTNSLDVIKNLEREVHEIQISKPQIARRWLLSNTNLGGLNCVIVLKG